MNTEAMIAELKVVAEKHKNDFVLTVQKNISAMCRDIIPKLEKLVEYEAIGTVEECREARQGKSRGLKRNMRRLTRKLDSETVLFIDYEHKNPIEKEPCGMDYRNNRIAIEKLAEYEDLEEQGKLLKLPCKAGQKVYLLRKDIKSIIDGEITSIRIGEFASEIKIFIIDDNRYIDASFDKIGDIVFFTRAEAEAALRE